MPNYNRVILMGNLTRDVEVRDAGGSKVSDFGLAVNRKFKTKDGEMKEETTFVDCEAWNFTGENIAKFFTKGRPIHVEGRLRLDAWEDKESGGKRSRLKVVVDSFEFVNSNGNKDGGGSDGGDDQESAPSAKKTAASSGKKMTKKQQEAVTAGADDIPF